jgi:DNA ligase-1
MLIAPVYRLYQYCKLTPGTAEAFSALITLMLRIRTGIPVSPMLAKPSKSFSQVLARMSGQLFTCEYK